MKKIFLLGLLILLCGTESFGSGRYLGDLNGDGKVDLADMGFLANAIKSGTGDSSCDINGSGKIDNTDLVKLADIILSSQLIEEEGFKVGIGSWDDDDIDYGGEVGGTSTRSDSGQQAVFYMNNPVKEPSTGCNLVEFGTESISSGAYGLLMNIHLPSSLELNPESLISLNGSSLDGHQLYGTPLVQEKEGSKVLRFIIFSSDLKPLKSTSGSLGKIRYKVTEAQCEPIFKECEMITVGADKSTVISDHSGSTIVWHIVEAESVLLSATTLSLKEGETSTLAATVSPENATDKAVTWTLSDSSVAAVSNSGVVTAVKAGTATITATTANGITANCAVTVTAKVVIIDVTGITMNTTTLSLKEGETSALTATVSPENATDKTVTWTSSDSSVATVSNSGVVTAVKAGTATITATTANGITATCAVSVTAKVVTIDVTGITLSATTLSLKEGETSTLTATVSPENATDKTVTWSSSDASVATVSNSGVVTAVKAGTATITATSANGITTTCAVTVSAKVVIIDVTGITLSATTLSLKEGDTSLLTATISPENATDKTVTWTSSDSSVATVSTSGVVTAVKAGTATVTATTANGVKATCTITVISDSSVNTVSMENLTVKVENGKIVIIGLAEETEYAIYSVNGMKVKTGVVDSYNNTIEDVQNGIFIVKVGGITKKVVL